MIDPGRRTLLILLSIILAGLAWTSFLPGLVDGSTQTRTQATVALRMRVAPFAVLNVVGAENLRFRVLKGQEKAPGGFSSENTYLHYTSTVRKGRQRSITAQLDAGSQIPNGTHLELQALPSGRLHEGISSGAIVASATARTVISAIGSCATGTDKKDGAQVILSLVLDSTSPILREQPRNISLTYTITDES